MKYWVIFNNKQEGPFTLEELRHYPLTMNTPVWHQGLPQWVQAQEVAELRSLIEQKNPAPQTPYGTAPYVREQSSAPQQSAYGQQPSQAAGQQQAYPRQTYAQQQYAPRKAAPQDNGREPRPSNYLGWAIAATLLCCMPIGVVAIIYAAGVNTKYDRGDIEGASKASDRAQLWIMLSVVLGLLWMPLGTIIQLLIQS